MYYFIEDNGYDGLNIEECKTIDSLKKTIRKSDTGAPSMIIKGQEIKMKWEKDKKGYWDKSKALDIPELGIRVSGESQERRK